MELEFYAGFFKQLNFLKIKFQNRSISLNSFNQGAFCWKVSMKKSIWRKSSYRQLNLKNNKIIKKTCMELEFHAGFFKQLDFLKIKYQNRGIFLNSFKHRAFNFVGKFG